VKIGMDKELGTWPLGTTETAELSPQLRAKWYEKQREIRRVVSILAEEMGVGPSHGVRPSDPYAEKILSTEEMRERLSQIEPTVHKRLEIKPMSLEAYYSLPEKIRTQLDSQLGEMELDELKKIQSVPEARAVLKGRGVTGLEEPFWLNPPDWVGGIAAGYRLAGRAGTTLGREALGEVTMGGSELARLGAKGLQKLGQKGAVRIGKGLVDTPATMTKIKKAVSPSGDLEFPITTNVQHGDFILKDGSMLSSDMDHDKLFNFVLDEAEVPTGGTHVDLEKGTVVRDKYDLGKIEATLSQFREESGIIRFQRFKDGGATFEVWSPPTEAQYKQMDKVLKRKRIPDDLEAEELDIMVGEYKPGVQVLSLEMHTAAGPKYVEVASPNMADIKDAVGQAYGWGERGAVDASLLFPFEHGKQVTAAGKEWLEAVKIRGRTAKFFLGDIENLRRAIIPQVDDLEKEGQMAFLQYRVGKGKRQEVVNDIVKDLWKLDPENHNVALLWMTVDDPKQIATSLGMKSVDELMQPKYLPGIHMARKLRGVYSDWGAEEVARGLLNRETYIKNMATYLPDMAWTKEYPHLFGTQPYRLTPEWQKKWKLDLSRFMQNRGIIDRHKEEFLKIQDLKYLGPKSLGQISESIETAKLYHTLEKTPGYVFADKAGLKAAQQQYLEAFAKAGIDPEKGLKKLRLHDSQFQKITAGAEALNLSGRLVRRDVITAISDTKNLLREIPTLYDQFLSLWKVGKVILRFPTHVRNVISNWILNDIGGLPFYRMDYYSDALTDLVKAANGKESELVKLAKKYGVLLPSLQRDELNMMQRAFGTGKMNLFDYLHKIAQPAARLYQAEEHWFKLAKFKWHIDHEVKDGLMDVSDAALAAIESTFDYGTRTPTLQRARRTIMPFATWMFKSIPYLAKQSVEHPLRVGKWLMMIGQMQKYGVEKVMGSEEEWKRMQGMMPKWMENRQWLVIPDRDSKGRIVPLDLTFILPWGDIAEMFTDPSRYFVSNPVLTISADLTRNKDFAGRNIWYKHEKTKTKVAKGLMHAYRQLMPGYLPGNYDFNKLYQAATRQDLPGTLTPAQAVAYNFGMKVTPFTEDSLKQQLMSQYQTDMSDLNEKFRRKRHRAKPGEQDKVIDEYQRERERIQKDYQERLE